MISTKPILLKFSTCIGGWTNMTIVLEAVQLAEIPPKFLTKNGGKFVLASF